MIGTVEPTLQTTVRVNKAQYRKLRARLIQADISVTAWFNTKMREELDSPQPTS